MKNIVLTLDHFNLEELSQEEALNVQGGAYASALVDKTKLSTPLSFIFKQEEVAYRSVDLFRIENGVYLPSQTHIQRSI